MSTQSRTYPGEFEPRESGISGGGMIFSGTRVKTDRPPAHGLLTRAGGGTEAYRARVDTGPFEYRMETKGRVEVKEECVFPCRGRLSQTA